MTLDPATLITLATLITGLLGAFLLVLWSQERSTNALAWWGGAYVLGASAVALWGAHALPFKYMNAALFVACGMLFNGARLFHGRKLMPHALWAGATVWLIAIQVPAFAASGHARVVLCSMLIASYAFLTAFELQCDRRRNRFALWNALAISLLHSTVFLVPAAQLLLPHAISTENLLILFGFETVIYVVGTALVVVVMAKEKVTLIHKTAAMTDLLTGIFNRRAFLEASHRLIAARARKSQPVSVLLFDLDKFKSINDRFGHAVGDDALKVFASSTSGSIRSTDVIARLGGEEFACIIPGNSTEAGIVAERLRSVFQEAGQVISGHEIGATVSIGVATAIAPCSIDALLARADAALYRAKNNGRNRVEFDRDEPAPVSGKAATPAEPKAAPAVDVAMAA